ncbi:uncharacterized protein C8Q71DRAFT_742550 [Rhodofomes roseus]|uniref:Uncharacterized protein n=1 Tax=Rhodofomes roseus TaxID=34475 RepID=A0ABQ8KQR1_9APHY|nr:uncharacterized protein C8Q71DRAFT_742550 [Rhodofomes roseus]KAH9840968.1 hypothetical protein C8Q71DRAFT_742550 [Rhodofomes roseus]
MAHNSRTSKLHVCQKTRVRSLSNSEGKMALESKGLDMAVVEMAMFTVLEDDVLAYQVTIRLGCKIAWPIYSDISLSNFESALANLRKLLDFSAASCAQSRIRLLFARTAGIFRHVTSGSCFRGARGQPFRCRRESVRVDDQHTQHDLLEQAFGASRDTGDRAGDWTTGEDLCRVMGPRGI